MNVLVTGANGFVGGGLLKVLTSSSGYSIRGTVRRVQISWTGTELVGVGNIHKGTNWAESLVGIDVVIHTAARVHVMNDVALNQLAEYRAVNTEGTLNLARQSAKLGVKRFVFLSSIKVNGELTGIGKAFTEKDGFIPNDPYGLSKYEAEQELLELSKETGMEVTIIRPSLVYGVGVKANFLLMIKWVKKGIPLPFGAIYNQRSFIALDNLVSFIVRCIDHPKAANEVFLISDGEDVSTAELSQKLAKAFGKKALLIPLPVSLMRFMAKLLGKEDVAGRLLGSLRVDSSKARDLLGWKPVVTMDEQLKKMRIKGY